MDESQFACRHLKLISVASILIFHRRTYSETGWPTYHHDGDLVQFLLRQVRLLYDIKYHGVGESRENTLFYLLGFSLLRCHKYFLQRFYNPHQYFADIQVKHAQENRAVFGLN